MFGRQVSENVSKNIIQGRRLEASSDFSFPSLRILALGLRSSDWEVKEQRRSKEGREGGRGRVPFSLGREDSTPQQFQQISRDQMASIFCSRRPHSHCSRNRSRSPLGSRCCRSHNPRCTPGGSRSCPSSSLGRWRRRRCCSAWYQEWRAQVAGECVSSV